MTSKLSPEEAIAKLFDAFAAVYAQRWQPDPNGVAGWLWVLGDYSGDAIWKVGQEWVRSGTEEAKWPPAPTDLRARMVKVCTCRMCGDCIRRGMKNRPSTISERPRLSGPQPLRRLMPSALASAPTPPAPTKVHALPPPQPTNEVTPEQFAAWRAMPEAARALMLEKQPHRARAYRDAEARSA